MVDEKKKNNNLFWLLLLPVFAGIFGIVLYFLLNVKETRITEDIEFTEPVTVRCESNKIEEGFFVNDSEDSSSHIVKLVFENNKLERLFYNYEAVFSSGELAESMNARLHGKYNKYMANLSLDPDTLKPTFSSNDNIVKIALITNTRSLNSNNIDFFFLDNDVFQHIKSYVPEKLKDYYVGKGFSCDIFE